MNGHSYDLGEPMWKIAQREKPLRDIAVAERVKELQEQRDLINYELEVLQPRKTHDTSPQDATVDTRIINSLGGFHDPRKHSGLTANEFLALYKKRMAKKNTDYHASILQWMTAHEEETLSFIRHRFTRTIKKG